MENALIKPNSTATNVRRLLLALAMHLEFWLTASLAARLHSPRAHLEMRWQHRVQARLDSYPLCTVPHTCRVPRVPVTRLGHTRLLVHPLIQPFAQVFSYCLRSDSFNVRALIIRIMIRRHCIARTTISPRLLILAYSSGSKAPNPTNPKLRTKALQIDRRHLGYH